MDRACAVDAVLAEQAGGQYDVQYVAASHGVLEIQVLVWIEDWVEVPGSPFKVSVSAGVQQWSEAAAALRSLLHWTPVCRTLQFFFLVRPISRIGLTWWIGG